MDSFKIFTQGALVKSPPNRCQGQFHSGLGQPLLAYLLDRKWSARRNCGLIAGLTAPEPIMGNKIRTEADRKATPRPAAPEGVTPTVHRGQKSSLERGTHTRSKKNPGKRPHKGG